MINFDNTAFYDNASGEYSNKRYNGMTTSYIQFFFKKRLDLTLSIIRKNFDKRKDLKILESGCADGIVIDTILNTFPENFSSGIGTDISPKMIEIANKKNINKKINYFLKGSEENGSFDFVLAIGFVSPGIFEREFNYIKDHLKKDGIIIISLASKNSIYTKLKLQNEDYIKDYWNHGQYEEFFKKDFELLVKEPYGLFIPKLWAFPMLARILQPIIENVFKFIIPNLFHEKLYVLKHKREF